MGRRNSEVVESNSFIRSGIHWYRKNDDRAESNVLSLRYRRIIPRDVEDNHGLLPESFNTYQNVDSGSIILRLIDLQNDKRSLRLGMANAEKSLKECQKENDALDIFKNGHHQV